VTVRCTKQRHTDSIGNYAIRNPTGSSQSVALGRKERTACQGGKRERRKKNDKKNDFRLVASLCHWIAGLRLRPMSRKTVF